MSSIFFFKNKGPFPIKKIIDISGSKNYSELDKKIIIYDVAGLLEAKKKDPLNTQIFKMYTDYRDIQANLKNNLDSSGKIKVECREIDIKNSILSSKFYKSKIESINEDL